MTNKNLSRELSCSFAKNGSPDCSAGSPPPCASYALCSLALCEICGIKPRYGIYENFGDLDNNFQLVTNERKYRLIADTRYHYGVEDDDLRNLKPVYYPDFEQPTNFVRLLNTNTDYITKNNKKILCKSIWWYINSDAKRFGQIAPYGIDTFLITLILILKNKDNLYNQSEIDKIKQAIKSEVWKYD